MSKKKTQFICQECSYHTSKWMGRCPNCNSWNTFTEVQESTKAASESNKRSASLQKLTEISVDSMNIIASGFSGLDRILGGGFVPGSSILLGGEPGIGKSTLVLQIAVSLARKGLSVLYASGEESGAQIRLRIERIYPGLSVENLDFFSSTDVLQIKEITAKKEYDFVFIDSVQTAFINNIETAPGTIIQVRESAFELTRLAAEENLVIVLIAHITKEGNIAGPKQLEHLVDAVFYFEGARVENSRVLRAYKNRFGNVDEVSLFQMTDKGLQELENLSNFFTQWFSGEGIFGSVLVPVRQGSMVIINEIQSLVVDLDAQQAKRAAEGIDLGKIHMMVAVLDKYAGFTLRNDDVFVRLATDLTRYESALDLALLAALISSVWQKALPIHTFFLGELSLSGQVRPVTYLQERLSSMEKIGWERAVISSRHKKDDLKFSGELFSIDTVVDLAAFLRSMV